MLSRLLAAAALALLLGFAVTRWRLAQLHTRILLGLGIGAAAGIAGKLWFPGAPWLMWVVDNVANPVGQVFLRMLFMIVIPLIFGSVTMGVASLGDLKKIGRVGGKAFGFFFLTTAAAATIGLTLMNLIAPGRRMDPAVRADLLAQYGGEAAQRLGGGIDFGVNTFVNIVPRNIVDTMARMDMLGLIFFSIIFGVALTQIPREKAQPIMAILDGLVEAVSKIIDYAMRLAPYGVAGLIFAVTVRFGTEVLQSLAFYVGTVMLGLILHLTGVIGLLAKFVAGIPYRVFFRKCRTLMVTAFSTSSSNATLPGEHQDGGGGVRRAQGDRLLRAAARGHDEHERHRAVRGNDGALPVAGVRPRAQHPEPDRGGGALRDHRRRRSRGARRLDPAARADPHHGGDPRRGDRPDPRGGPDPRHESHGAERDGRPAHRAGGGEVGGCGAEDELGRQGPGNAKRRPGNSPAAVRRSVLALPLT